MHLKTLFTSLSASILHSSAHARRTGVISLGTFLFIWAAFSGAHLLQMRGYLASEQWLLFTDGGYAEYFEHILLLIASVAFLKLFLRSRDTAYAVIAVILVYITADNALRLHEIVGEHYAAAGFGAPLSRLLPKQYGEVLFLGAAGAILLTALFLAARKAVAPARQAAWIIAALILCIGLFSAVIDTVGGMAGIWQLVFLEDCGEFFTIALIAAYAMFLTAKLSPHNGPATG